MPRAFNNILEKMKLQKNDIDLFVFHQANQYMLQYIRKKLGIPEDKFFINVENLGNTVSSSIPIALKEAIDQGVLKTGNKIMLMGFGVGLSWAATVIQF